MTLGGKFRPAVAVAAVLAAIIAGEILLGGPAEEVPPKAAPEAPTPSPAALFSPGNAVEAVLARPLFLPERRGAAGAEMAAAPDAELPRLTGIIVTSLRRLAVFQPPGGKPRTVHEGDDVGGWTIRKIDHQQVVVQKSGGAMTTIMPAKDPAAGATPGSGTPPGPGQVHGQLPPPPTGLQPPNMAARP